MRRRIITALLAIACAAGPAAAAEYAGTVKSVRGPANAVRAGQQIPLTVGTRLEPHDRIVTGDDALLGITLRDETLLSIGPRADVSLEAYSFDQDSHRGSFVASIARGAMYMVTGLIGRRNRESVVVKTTTATIGIRGTEFVIEVGE